MTLGLLKQLSLLIAVRKLRGDLNKDYVSARAWRASSSKQVFNLVENVTTKAKD